MINVEDFSRFIKGGDGNDFLSGSLGNDTLTGGKGSDLFFLSSGFDVVTDFKNDRIKEQIDGNHHRPGGELDSIEFSIRPEFVMISFDGSDTSLIFNDGSMPGMTKFLNSDPNEIYNSISHVSYVDNFYILTSGFTLDPSLNDGLPGVGDEHLKSPHGKGDVIKGGDGNDFLFGSLGDDTLTGGKGSDLFFLSSGFDVVTDFKNDRIQEQIDGNPRRPEWEFDSELDSIEIADNYHLMISFDGSDTSLIFSDSRTLGITKFLNSDPNVIYNSISDVEDFYVLTSGFALDPSLS